MGMTNESWKIGIPRSHAMLMMRGSLDLGLYNVLAARRHTAPAMCFLSAIAQLLFVAETSKQGTPSRQHARMRCWRTNRYAGSNPRFAP